MPRSLIMVTAALCVALFTSATAANAQMKARFTDEAWTGDKIPEGQNCSRYGGAGATPPMIIDDVLEYADGIVLEFNDESYTPMDKGGHGIIAFKIDSQRPVRLPAVPGETNDLPDGVIKIKSHKAKSKPYTPDTAYLPPCSGGMGNKYTISVQAVQFASDGRYTVLKRTKITMGKY